MLMPSSLGLFHLSVPIAQERIGNDLNPLLRRDNCRT